MDRRKNKGRQDCIIQCGPVCASFATGVRPLVSVYRDVLSGGVHKM